MSDPTNGERSVEALAEENRALREERDRLRGEKRSKLRTVFTVVLIVLALLSLAATMPGLYVRRTFRDTDQYVATVSRIAEQPEVQAYLAARLTTEAFQALDVQGRLSSALGELDDRLAFLAPPITAAVEDLVREKVEELLASPTFQRLWAEINRVAHDQIQAALNGDESDIVQISDGAVVINTLPLVNEVLKGVSDFASDLLGRTVTLPEITADTVPSEAISQLESALGVDLPDDFGTIQVYESDRLAALQDSINTANNMIVLFAVLFLLFSAGALALSQRRRRTLLQLMTGFALVLVIERRSVIVALDSVVDHASQEAQAAVRAAADVLLGDFLRYTGWALALALLTILIALLTGPYRWAAWTRRGVADVASSVAGMVEGTEAGPAAQWIAGHRDLLMLAGAIVGALLFLWLDLSFWGFLVLVLLVGLFELAVWRTSEALGRAPEPG